MAKRKRHPKLPNGYGSISYLGRSRRNPYCVRPPVTEFNDDGLPIMPKPICYAPDWYSGFIALTAWKAGTYTVGMEKNIKVDEKVTDDVINRLLSDYSKATGQIGGLSFKEVYDLAFKHLTEHKTLSKNTIDLYKHGFNHCEAIHDRPLASLKAKDLQDVIDSCELSPESKAKIKTVMRIAYDYAISNDIVSTDYTKKLIIEKKANKHGQAFSDDELKQLWEESKADDMAKRAIIMCYSGFRVSAYKDLEVNLEEMYFKGGVKTSSSKSRIVPIHSSILPMVKELIERDGNIGIQRRYPVAVYLQKINKEATPHWTRHTFSALCEKYGVRENDRKRMLGHVVGDITNDVYGHRTLEDLRAEIEKIKVLQVCCK